MSPIVIQADVNAPIEKVWEMWTAPHHITNWAFASDDWEAPFAENSLTLGGKFKTTMSAKDKSASFDFEGKYSAVETHKLIEYYMPDNRHVKIEFTTTPQGVHIIQTFDPENENPIDFQRQGWQAILDNFVHYVHNN